MAAELSATQVQELIARQIDKVRGETLDATYGDIPPEMLVWLAISPVVQSRVLHALNINGASIEKRLLENGVLEPTGRTWLPNPGDERYFRVSSGGRKALLDALGRRDVQANLPLLTKRAASVVGTVKGLPETTARLVELARLAGVPANAAALLDARLEEAYGKRDTEALASWLAVARPLAEVFARTVDSTLLAALQQAVRKGELLRREREDEQYLTSFLERSEQIDSVNQLIDDRGDHWALSLLGSGGVGKTMLLRYVAARMARERRLSTARVDFDYLSADYPQRDPGRLLGSFADELQYGGGTRATTYFEKAKTLLDELRREIAADRATLGRVTQHPYFVQAIQIYIDALRQLRSPVLLVFDTCEELAKVRANGEISESVQETFRILGALRYGPQYLSNELADDHGGGFEGLRVIFAGRRPLARAGWHWQCPTSPLPERPFLRLHELRGFDRSEAETYLRTRLNVPEALIKPIILSSKDTDPPASITYDDVLQQDDRERMNPYLLHLFGRWASEAPDAAEQIKKGVTSSRYIELRILRRITYTPLLELMPVISIARHVDREMIAAVSGESDTTIEAILRELSGQEWAEMRRVPVGRGSKSIMTVKPNVQRELSAYFRDSLGDATDVFERAVVYYQNLTLSAPLEQLDWSVFDAALRLLERDPDRGARWWSLIERRAARERGFAWLRDLTSNLLAEDNAVAAPKEGKRENPLRACVAATYASAQRHLGEPTYEFSLQLAPILETSSEFFRLRLRREAARLTSWHEYELPSAQLRTYWEALLEPAEHAVEDEELVAGAFAACDAVLDLVEGRKSEAGNEILQLLDDEEMGLQRLAASLYDAPPDADRSRRALLRAHALILAGRVAVLLRGPRAAVMLFQRAIGVADEVPAGRYQFLDWLPPDEVALRARIEAVRLLYPRALSCNDGLELLRWREVANTPQHIDGDRWMSLRFMLTAAQGDTNNRASTPLFDETEALNALRFASACYAHRQIAPLFVTTARLFAATGQVQRAVGMSIHALTTGFLHVDVIRHIERVLLDLDFRMRGTVRTTAGASTAESPASDDRQKIWLADAIRATVPSRAVAPPAVAYDPDWMHSRWESLTATEPAAVQEWVQNLKEHDVLQGASPWERVQLRLDLAEARLMAPAENEEITCDWVSQLRSTSVDPVREVVIALRTMALFGQQLTDVIDERSRRVGRRATAELILTTAERMALRVPAASVLLFDLADDWFSKLGDTATVFFSRTGSALARIAASQKFDFAHVVAAYRDIRTTDVLPPWEQLRAASKKDVADQLAPAWEGWLMRLLVVSASPPAPLKRAIDLPQPVTSWVTAARTENRLPPDVHATLATFARGVRPEQPSFWSRAWQPFLVVGGFAAVLGGLFWSSSHVMSAAGVNWLTTSEKVIFVIGVLILAAITLDRLTGTPNEWRSMLLSVSAMGLGFFGARSLHLARPSDKFVRDVFVWFVLLIWLVPIIVHRFWRRVERRRGSARLSIRGTDKHEYVMTLESDLPALRLFPFPRVKESIRIPDRKTEATVDMTGHRGTDIPDKIRQELDRFRSKVPDRFALPIQLSLAAHDADRAWERLLAGDSVAGKKLTYDFFRTPTGVSTEPYNGSGPATTEIWGGAAATERVARSGWGEGVRHRVDAEKGEVSARVLHIVGTIDSRTSGVAFRLRAGAETLLPPAEIWRVAQYVALCIVQAEPLTESGSATATDALDAQLARRFGAELALCGVPAVLVVPRVETEIAVAIARLLMKTFRKEQELDRTRLLTMVREIRHIIRDSGTESAEALRLAYDVALYCRPSWRFRKT